MKFTNEDITGPSLGKGLIYFEFSEINKHNMDKRKEN